MGPYSRGLIQFPSFDLLLGRIFPLVIVMTNVTAALEILSEFFSEFFVHSKIDMGWLVCILHWY